MARKLASIVEVGEILPIEGADRIEVAIPKGKGWKVVVGKGEFKVGDLCVYFEIDSYLPADDERYAFLKDRCLRKFVSKSGIILREGLRIKSIKLRGQVSQGLLMPVDKFPEVKSRIIICEKGAVLDDGKVHITDSEVFVAKTEQEYIDEINADAEKYRLEHDGKDPDYEWKQYFIGSHCVPVAGADVTALLHVEHYDEVKEQLQPAMGNPISAEAKGKFPSDYIPKTDEERIQNLGDWFEKMKGRLFQISVKHDGTSCTMAWSPTIDPNEPEIVCSRNLRLKKPETEDDKVPVYWQMAKKYEMMGNLKAFTESNGIEYAVQGEIVGPGIQKDRNKEKEPKFLVFRIYDITHQQWVNPKETIIICGVLKLEHVQIVEHEFPFFDKITSMDEALKYAEGKTAEGNEREGIVLKSVDDKPYASCKIVSNKYLLKQED